MQPINDPLSKPLKLAEKCQDLAATLRRKPMALSDLIPFLCEVADELRGLSERDRKMATIMSEPAAWIDEFGNIEESLGSWMLEEGGWSSLCKPGEFGVSAEAFAETHGIGSGNPEPYLGAPPVISGATQEPRADAHEYRLVPVQPTAEMIEAMCAAHTHAGWPDDFGGAAQVMRREQARAGYAAALEHAEIRAGNGEAPKRGCMACALRAALIGEASRRSDVAPAYLDWLKTHSRNEGVSGNEAWDAGVAWASRNIECGSQK